MNKFEPKLTIGALAKIFKELGIKTVESLVEKLSGGDPEVYITVLTHTTAYNGTTRDDVEACGSFAEITEAVAEAMNSFFGEAGSVAHGNVGESQDPLV